MTKEEIEDFLEMNYDNNLDGIVDYIFNMESELLKCQKGLDAARLIIKGSVSKDRYNNIVKKYDKLAKERGEK